MSALRGRRDSRRLLPGRWLHPPPERSALIHGFRHREWWGTRRPGGSPVRAGSLPWPGDARPSLACGAGASRGGNGGVRRTERSAVLGGRRDPPSSDDTLREDAAGPRRILSSVRQRAATARSPIGHRGLTDSGRLLEAGYSGPALRGPPRCRQRLTARIGPVVQLPSWLRSIRISHWLSAVGVDMHEAWPAGRLHEVLLSCCSMGNQR